MRAHFNWLVAIVCYASYTKVSLFSVACVTNSYWLAQRAKPHKLLLEGNNK